MKKPLDISTYSFDQLSQLIGAAEKRAAQLRGKRVKELQTELSRLGSDHVGTSTSRSPQRSKTRGVAGSSSTRMKAVIGRKVAAQFRGPNGQEYSGRGAIPKWARDLGVQERGELEQYRIGSDIAEPRRVSRSQNAKPRPTKGNDPT